MAASAFQGTKFEIGSPLVTVTGVRELPQLPMKKKIIDTTPINATAEESIADNLTTYEDFTLLLDYDKDDTQHIALLAAYTGETSVAGRLTMNDGETFTGNFRVFEWTPAGSRGGTSQRRLTMRPTGAITIA